MPSGGPSGRWGVAQRGGDHIVERSAAARTMLDIDRSYRGPTREGETVRRKFLKLKNAELQRHSA